MEQKSKILVLLATAMLLFATTSCTIARYSFTPADQIQFDRPLTANAALSVYLPQAHSDPSFERRLGEPIQQGLVGVWLFNEAIVVLKRPDTGTYVSVTIDYVPTHIGPSLKAIPIFIGMLTSYAIPYYGVRPGGGQPPWHWTSQPVATYTLNVDQVEKGVYRYPIDEKIFRWILAPSLVYWLLSTFPDQAEVLTSTARQFVRDAQRDGHW